MTGSEGQATPPSRGVIQTLPTGADPLGRHAWCLCHAVALLKIELSLGNSDSLSSEQTGIQRPCAGANHCEGSAQCRKYDVHRSAGGGKQEKRHFGDRHEKARYWRPKPDGQERRTDGGQKLEDDRNGEGRSL